jgi:hypothetical protein
VSARVIQMFPELPAAIVASRAIDDLAARQRRPDVMSLHEISVQRERLRVAVEELEDRAKDQTMRETGRAFCYQQLLIALECGKYLTALEEAVRPLATVHRLPTPRRRRARKAVTK